MANHARNLFPRAPTTRARTPLPPAPKTRAEVKVENFIRLAAKWARKFAYLGYDEALTAATDGLMLARDRWDPAGGASFATYAIYWMRGMLGEAVKRKRRYDAHFVSSTIISNDGTEQDIADITPDDAPNPEQTLIASDNARHAREQIQPLLPQLKERERRVIEAHIMADQPLSLDELALEFGVSRERVRQMEIRALQLLRDAITAGSTALADRKPYAMRRLGKTERPPRRARRQQAPRGVPDKAVVAAAVAAAPAGVSIKATFRALLCLPAGLSSAEAALVSAALFPGAGKPQISATKFPGVTATRDAARGAVFRLPAEETQQAA